ncbi:MAG: PIN domain-containing protein [Geminicoccaceae bacterium]
MTVALDTNVLIYAIDTAAGHRHASAGALIRRVLLGGQTILILQTMTEFYSVATRKFRISSRDALLFLDELRRVFAVHAADERDFDRATRGDRHGLSFWDAMLWATAERIGAQYLLSEDFPDRRVLGGVTFVNPFEAGNEALLAEILPLS